MAIDSSLGTKLSIVAGEPATFDSTGYEDLTYQLVGEVSEIGEFGGTREVPTHTPIDTGIVAKRAGSINYGTQTLQIAHNPDDTGQDDLQSGLDGANAGDIHSVKLEDPAGNVLYYTAIVAGYTFNPGSANSIYAGSVTLDITSKPVAVAAV